MASSYPGALDTAALFPTRTDLTPSITKHAADHNNLADAIIKIQTELGTDPSGASDTVANRLAAMPEFSSTTNPVLVNLVGDGVVQPAVVTPYLAPTKLTTPGTIPSSISYACAWSPNGRYLAVASQTGTPNTIYVYERNGTKITKGISLPAGTALPAVSCSWSPDGVFLLVTYSGAPYVSLYQRDSAGWVDWALPSGMPSSNTPGGGWSPDGKILVVINAGSSRVVPFKRSGTTFTQLALPTAPLLGTGCSWSPDGRFLAVTYQDSSPYIVIYERINAVFTALSSPASAPAGLAYSSSWSPDGRFLVVTHQVAPYITIYERNGTTFTKLPDPATLPGSTSRAASWSPDGRFLAVTCDVSPFLIVYSRTGTTFTKVADPSSLPPGYSTGVSWSPEGKFLAVTSNSTPYITVYSSTGTIPTTAPAPLTLLP